MDGGSGARLGWTWEEVLGTERRDHFSRLSSRAITRVLDPRS